MRHVVAASMVMMLMTGVRPAAAQEPARADARIATDGVEIMAGVMDFDLSGTGWTTPFDFRASKSLTHRLAIEFGVTMASPDQQIGPSQLVIPEAKVSYSWRLGRVRPFVSGGAGVAVIGTPGFDNRWRPTFVGGGGARVQASDLVYVVGEMRLRGLSKNFSGTTAEWLGGIGFSLR